MTLKKSVLGTLVLAYFLLFPIGVNALELEAIFSKACNKAAVSKNLAMTIARHESRMNPLAVNIAGKSYYPETHAEALALIQGAITSGDSFDVGLMQINRFWLQKWNLDPESLLDPETNIATGVKILAEEIRRHGFTWNAVGAYHSPSSDRASTYAWRIYQMGNQASGQEPNQKTEFTPEEKSYGQTSKGTQGLLLHRGSPDDRRTGITGRIINF